MKKYEKLQKVLVVIAYLLILTLIIPPVFNRFFNRIDPWIMGLPFLIFWVIFINIAIAVILLILWNIDKKV